MKSLPREGGGGRRALALLAWALPLAAVLASRLLIAFSKPWALGLDGYYYALQTDSFREAGRLLYQDPSLAFPLLAGLSFLTGSDAVLASKLTFILSSLLGTALFLLALRRLGASSLPMLAAGLAWALSPIRAYMDIEFLKQSAGLAAWAGLIASLAKASSLEAAAQAGGGGRGSRSPFLRFIFPALWTLLAAAFHLLSGSLALGTLLSWTFFRGGRRGRIAAAATGAAALGAFLALSISGAIPSLDLGRLGRLSPGAPLERLSSILSTGVPFWEKAELLLLPLAGPLLFLGAFLYAGRRPGQSSGQSSLLLSLGIMALLLSFPFLAWSFDSASFRFLLATGLPAAFALWISLELLAGASPAAAGKGRVKRSGLLRILPSFLVAGIALALLIPSARAFQRLGRFPNWASLDQPFSRLASLVPEGKSVVAGRGIAAFARWKSGLRTEIFSPSAADARDWYRIARGMGARAFDPFRRQGEGPALDLAPGWVLLPEPLWRRFDAVQGPDAAYRKLQANPRAKRPSWDGDGAGRGENG